ncbi:MAG: ribosome biogenesis GTP-binding protein YihA/YsxC [Candidatus Fermentibacteraceae bacterium]
MPGLALSFLRSCPGGVGLPDDGRPEVAFTGRSNVGKSSLINCLAGGTAVARTSSSPGCTRFINIYTSNFGYYVADLPGYGYARAPGAERSRWLSWMEDYLGKRRPLRGSVLLVDCRHPEMESDVQMAEFLRGCGKPYIVALTKSDKLGASKLAESRKKAGELGPVIPVSSVRGSGIRELLRWLVQVTVD